MTVAALPSTVSYTEDGVSTLFPVPFRFRAAGDLLVERVSGGTAVALQLGVDYAVAGGGTDAGGTVTRTVASVGAQLRISRRTARAQPMVYNPNDRFPAKSHEEALDRGILIAQELGDAVEDVGNRALLVPIGESTSTLPLAAERAGRAIVGLPGGGFGVATIGDGDDPTLRPDLAAPNGGSHVGFSQPGAPDTPTTLLDEARFTVRPEQFVRAGDTSMAQAINRASVAVAANGGGVVDLRGVAYPVDYPILLGSRVCLRGKGRATRIVQTGSPASWVGLPGLGIIVTDPSASYDGVSVERLAVIGLHATPVPDGSAVYARLGIALANVINSTVDRCLVQDTGTGIAMYGTVAGQLVYGNRIINSRTKNTKSWIGAGNPGTPRAINLSTPYSDVLDCVIETTHTGVYGSSEFGKIRNTRVRDFFDDGFYLNANDMDVSECRASDGPGSGLAANPGQRNKIDRFTALRCLNAGVRYRHAGLLAPRYNSLTNSIFIECGYGFLDDMIGADANPANAVAAFNVFTGNKAVRCNLSGFRFQRHSASTITDNQAIDCNQAGITADTRGGFSFVSDCTTNKIANNICDDTQGAPTQAFGLYVYGGAGNVGNDVRHLSRLGVDLFMPMRQSGTVTLSIPSGARANTTPTITFPMAFEGVPRVMTNIQNADDLADAERPMATAARSVTSSGFRAVADGHANMAATRTVSIAWFATVEAG